MNQVQPPTVYPDNVSEDEEWLMVDPLGEPVSDYYVQAIEKMCVVKTSYINLHSKARLLWAVSH